LEINSGYWICESCGGRNSGTATFCISCGRDKVITPPKMQTPNSEVSSDLQESINSSNAGPNASSGSPQSNQVQRQRIPRWIRSLRPQSSDTQHLKDSPSVSSRLTSGMRVRFLCGALIFIVGGLFMTFVGNPYIICVPIPCQVIGIFALILGIIFAACGLKPGN
jgi:ribosomal protein L40E